MRHRKRNIKFGRHPAHRKATVNSLLYALVKYNRIETTLAKAKETRRLADRLITWAKKGGLHNRRMAYSILKDRDLVGVLFKDLGPLFAKRCGGYTRVMHTRIRPGDGAQLAILEWTEKKEVVVLDKKKAKKEIKAKVEAKKDQVKQESKQQVKEDKAEVKHEEKPHVEEKKHEIHKPKYEEQKQKGFLGGIRKIFGSKKGQ